MLLKPNEEVVCKFLISQKKKTEYQKGIAEEKLVFLRIKNLLRDLTPLKITLGMLLSPYLRDYIK